MSEQTEWLANARFAALVSGNAFHTRELAEGKLDLQLSAPAPPRCRARLHGLVSRGGVAVVS